VGRILSVGRLGQFALERQAGVRELALELYGLVFQVSEALAL
jgi:hypothetical protein